MKEVPHILDHFDKNEFKDIDCWKCKFYNGDLVMYYEDMYISVQDAFNLAVVKRSDMHKF